MNFKYIFLIGAFIFASFMAQSNELVIEVTTDKYPAETSWKLFDTNFNLVQTNGTLQKNTVHRDTILLDMATCYYWTLYDSYGDGMSNSAAPGDFKLYLNGELITQCENPNFGDSISVYGIGTQCALIDASVTDLTFNQTQAFNPFLLSFSVVNFGSEAIQSLTFWYDVDGWESEYITLDNLNIEFGQTVELNLPDCLQFTNPGTVTIGLHIIQVNNAEDENQSNNFQSKTIEVLDGYWKKPMHEVFTSSTCAPCAAANPIIDATLDEFPEQYALIKYQVNWPSEGDPYYTNEVGYMVGQYGVNAAPSLFVDAYATNVNYLPADFEANSGSLIPIYLELEGNLVGDSIFARATITTQTAMGANAYLRLAVVEKTTVGNASSNGEDEFSHVFMKFVSEKAGSLVGQLPAGGSKTLEFSASLANTNIEEFTDLKLVGYVFYNNAYRILQSEMIPIPYAPAPPYLISSVLNGSVQVDTLPEIVISSSTALYNSDGSPLSNLPEKINFIKAGETSEPVAYEVNLAADYKSLTILPKAALAANSSYMLKIFDVASKAGVLADTLAINFITIDALHIEQNNLFLNKVYPNPCNTLLKLDLIDHSQIEISDLAGKTILLIYGQKGKSTIDLSGLNQGIYILSVLQNQYRQTIKLIKE